MGDEFEIDGDDPEFWQRLREKLGDAFVLTIEGEVYEVHFEGDEPCVRLRPPGNN